MPLCRSMLCMILLLASGPTVASAGQAAAEDAAARIAFFETRIRPILVDRCYECHSAAAGKSEGGLRLDSMKTIRAGGDRGPAVVPGDPDASILLTAISHSDPDLQMPPKRERLPESVVADVKAWIAAGAADPRDDEAAGVPSPPVDIETGRQFWAFQKPAAQQPPAASNPAWAKRDLDHFILAKLEAAGLAPSADAEPATLLRRLHFDLVGLPPSPAVVSDFRERIAADGLDAALEAEVDSLLASEQFGERWGRHWLDVARFAESSGMEANISFPYAWRYRDYVIDAVNADMPFDRFLVEQIAGDLLPYESDAQRARLLIATGFLALGPKNLEEGNALQFAADVIDEQIDAVSRAVMANSVACARCHDHKFDPFSMDDYYALAGVFASTKTYFGTFVSPANRVGGDPLVLPRGAGQPIFHASIPPERVAGLKAELAALQKEEAEGMAAVAKALQTGEDPEKFFTLRDALRIFWRSGGIEGELEKVDDSGQALPLAMGVLDGERNVDAPLLERGEIGRPGKTVPRGFPRVVEIAEAPRIPSDQSGRLELARWLTHPDHPLTARVMTNRVWRHLFGAGIVRTVDNFGFSGERPSHRELLDHLAVRFVADGWSVKKLVREIVLSRTYRQASTYHEAAFRADPDNRLLWRAAKRRLDAEAIRDAMLVVSGELDAARPAGSLVARHIGDRPISLIGLDASLPADLDGSLHRSVYLPVLRDRLPEVLDLFDFAEPSLVSGDRETTNVPLQALYLMNGSFVQSRARALAERLIREADDDEQRIRRAFLLCFSREADADEAKMAAAFLEQGKNLAGDEDAGGDGQQARRRLLAAYCQALLSTAEFRNLD
ncbi:MAG: PSD1 and planctomycete cytochrome C domain-containing protein [Pirellulales bacterium]